MRRARGMGGARRWRAAVGATAACFAIATGVALAAPGDLDPTFDTDGRRVIDAGGNDHAYGLAIRGNGQVVVVGFGGPATDILTTQLNANGSTDTSFSSGGLAGVDFGGAESGSEVLLQSDGSAVIAGHTTAGAGGDAAVARLTPGGALDTAGFGSGGKSLINWSTGDEVHDAALDAANRILVIGYSTPSTGMRITRLTPQGATDTSFAGAGNATFKFTGGDRGRGLALQADQKIVVVGATAGNFAVGRLDPNGNPDPSFGGGDGQVTIDVGGNDEAFSVAVQPDGKIVVGGSGGAGSNFVIARLLPDGTPDPAFVGNGVTQVEFGGEDRGRGVAVQANGKIVIAGDTTAGSDVAIARVQPNGALDTSFSGDGKMTVPNNGDDDVQGLALSATGQIYFAGSTSPQGSMVIGRVEGDGVDGAPAGGFGPTASNPTGPGSGGPLALPRCKGKLATVIGSPKKDRLKGTKKADVIVGLGGNDIITGLGGNDLICAGSGNDTVRGGGGKDVILGGAGKDKLFGDAGADQLLGQAGADRLSGGGGKDRLIGGGGRDVLLGVRGTDRVSGVEKLR